MPKGYFTGEKTHKSWTGSILAQYHGSVAAWARENEEKPSTVNNILSLTFYADCRYQPNRRVLSKLYHEGLEEFLLKDNLITVEFIPIPQADIYWTKLLVH